MNTTINIAQFENCLNCVKQELDEIKSSGLPSPSDSLPLIAGTASPGTSTKYSREDHVHPEQVNITGNAGTADKLKTPRLIGDESFDGSADINPERMILDIHGLPLNEIWQSICYGDGKFIAVPIVSNIAAYSTDGVIWKFQELPSSKYWYSVCYGGGRFVVIALSTNIAVYSDDGINWTQSTLPSSVRCRSICYGNGKFVSIDSFSSTSKVLYSTNGINWSTSDLPSSTDWKVYFGYNKFIAINEESSVLLYSTDAINWKPILINKNRITDENGNDITSHLKSLLGLN